MARAAETGILIMPEQAGVKLKLMMCSLCIRAWQMSQHNGSK